MVRNLLGCFLFRGDDVHKRVGVLSGGERSRVALVCMLLHPANFLILDEPTNHLDIQSQQVLQKALSEYPGSYCIVSHNRSFLDPIVTKVLEFVPGEKPRVYLGNVSDYLEKVEREQALAAAAASPPPGAAEPGAGLDRKARRAHGGGNPSEEDAPATSASGETGAAGRRNSAAGNGKDGNYFSIGASGSGG